MHKMMRYGKMIIPAILLACFATPALALKPITNVTAATGGNPIPNSNIASATWVSLTGPSLSETANNGISTGTFVLNAPTGFKFNTAATVTATVTRIAGASGNNLTLSSATATVTATTITINVASNSTGQAQNSITWSGIQVMPTACLFPAPNPGNITITGTSITNGTNLNTPNAGALTETGSTGMTFIQQPSNALVNASISPVVTINACGNGTVLPTVTVALTVSGGATLAGTLAVATTNATGLVTFNNLSVNLTGTYTLTATSPGLTTVVSNSFVISNPVPTTTSINPSSKNVGDASFTMTVNGTNFVSTSVARIAGSNRVTTYVSATQLTVSILAGDMTAAGTFNIDVVNPAPGGGTSNVQTFTVLNINPGRFNAFESSTAAGAIIGNIYTKLAGTSFTLDVVALNLAKTAVLTTFTGAVKVELLNASNNSVLPDANNCRSTWTTIQTLAANPTFVAADNGRKVGVSFTENNAWKEVRVRVTYPASGAATAIGCSTDTFSIRPTAFSSVTSNMTADASGTSSSATPTAKAGGNFTLTATAIAAYDGTPVIDATKVQAHAGAVATGAVGGAFAAAAPATGIATGASFTYSEVGYVKFAIDGIYDNLFTNLDQPSDCTNDFSNTLVGGKYGCKFGNTAATNFFGRFIPDHFSLTAGTVTAACLAGGFTYLGQNMATSFSLEARNLSDTKTQNYNGGFARLDGATASKWTTYASNDSLGLWGIATLPAPYATCNAIFSMLSPYDTTYSAASPTCPTTPASPIPQSPVALRLSVSAPTGSWTNGAGSFSAAVNLGRASVADGPYTYSLGLAPKDADGTVFSAAALNLDTDNVGGNERVSLGTMEERFGRLKLSNAHGSELLNLPVQLYAQYWNGTDFSANTLDSCTTLAANNFRLTPVVAGINPLAAVTFSAGSGKLILTKPTTAQKVTEDVCVDLGADVPVVCTNTAANKTYLQGAWTGAGYDDDPASRATFGVYKGSNEFIYLRENY